VSGVSKVDVSPDADFACRVIELTAAVGSEIASKEGDTDIDIMMTMCTEWYPFDLL